VARLAPAPARAGLGLRSPATPRAVDVHVRHCAEAGETSPIVCGVGYKVCGTRARLAGTRGHASVAPLPAPAFFLWGHCCEDRLGGDRAAVFQKPQNQARRGPPRSSLKRTGHDSEALQKNRPTGCTAKLELATEATRSSTAASRSSPGQGQSAFRQICESAVDAARVKQAPVKLCSASGSTAARHYAQAPEV
jgi:hypothetical protein